MIKCRTYQNASHYLLICLGATKLSPRLNASSTGLMRAGLFLGWVYNFDGSRQRAPVVVSLRTWARAKQHDKRGGSTGVNEETDGG